MFLFLFDRSFSETKNKTFLFLADEVVRCEDKSDPPGMVTDINYNFPHNI